jgi:redox-sensitive bicupin YhaK (pirin superfamily)
MIVHRPAHTRGNPNKHWISSYRTFSFTGYFNSKYRNFGHLRTINDDRVQPGGHVPIHEHQNMEIFGYVVEGVCRHTDSHGKVLDIPAGAVQRMSSGSGLSHTEGNATETPNRYLQLWIEPSVLDTDPVHEWHQFTREDKLNRFCDVTEKLPIKQDARLLAGIFTENYEFVLNPERKYYMYVVLGMVTVNSIPLIEGDGLSFVEEDVIRITSPQDAEIILFDLV